MKIVDVCAFYAPGGGGVRTYVERKLLAGPTRGHEIVVVAPGPETRLEVRGPGARIRWIRSPRFPLDRNYSYFADRLMLHRTLDEERPDIVEVSSPWRSASMVAEWQGSAQRALIAHADPLSAYAYRWFGSIADRPTIDRHFDWYWRHLRRLDRRFDHIVSASECLSERLRAGGLRRVVTNPMGIDPRVFSHDLRDLSLRKRMLRRCGLPETGILLLGVGRHSPEKRWEMIIAAATAAAGRMPVGLLLVGNGHAQRRIAKAVGANPHIRLLQPLSDRVALARLMASADALVHGCEAETFCFVAAEASACGTPLIVPELGGASDHARSSNDRLYRSGSAESAAAAIIAFATAGASSQSSGRIHRTMDDHFDALFGRYRPDQARRAA